MYDYNTIIALLLWVIVYENDEFAADLQVLLNLGLHL